MTELSTPARTLADAVSGLDLRTKAFIDGEPVDAVSGETFDCVSPITGEVIAQVASCDKADVDAAVRGARAAFESGCGRGWRPPSASGCCCGWPS